MSNTTPQQSKKPATHAGAHAGENLIFEEWQVRRELGTTFEKDGKRYLKTEFEKEKILRPRVKITQDEANIFNEGRIVHSSNRVFSVMLLPGQKLEPLVREIKEKR